MGGRNPQRDAREEELARAVEALIFAADEPMRITQIASIFSEITQESPPSEDAIRAAVEYLNGAYLKAGRALRVRFWAEGFRMTTIEEVAPYLKAYFRRDRTRRLTRPLMETLAILCYRQPCTKPEIDNIRGVDSDYAIRRLLDIGLVDVVGRADTLGRPILYGSTSRFLEEFGLADLGQLPNLREIEELLRDPAFNQERARLLMLRGLNAPNTT